MCAFCSQCRIGLAGKVRFDINMDMTTSTPAPTASLASLQRDPEVAAIVERERVRQVEGAELIASENYTSDAVMAAQGSILTNKYAEGLPGKRYYGGCEFVDQAERLAIDRLCQLFGATWANVQPHSGASANAAVMLACLKPGDTILGFDLAHGGHLTHGSPVNYSGKLYRPTFYGVEKGDREDRHGQGGRDGPPGKAPNVDLWRLGVRP